MFELILYSYFIIVFLLLVVMLWLDRKTKNVNQRYINKWTLYVLLGLLISIIISMKISVSADIPEYYELGAMEWVYRPLFIGMITILVYLAVLLFSRKLRLYAGIGLILLNVGVGIYYYQLI